MRFLPFLVCGVLLFPAAGGGCSKESHTARTLGQRGDPAQADGLMAFQGGGGEQGRPAEAIKQPPADRKIIFTADVYLKVADFAKAEQELQQLLKNNDGYTAQVDVSGSTGATRQGTWRVRVPVAKFVEFREAVKKIGELLRFTSEAKEVTEEYFDLQTRVKNKEAEVEAFRKIFDKGSGKIDEVLAVQREVSRAQGDLEQMIGRQRVLENLTELTTVTVHLAERDTYLPPTPLPPVAFGTTVGQTFFDSIDVLIAAGKALVLVAVAVAPWLPLIAVAGGLLWLLVRRRKIAPANVPGNPLPEAKAT